MKRTLLLCIMCPNGCRLSAVEEKNGFTVGGNQCERGIDFALAEINDPRRTLTTTVRTCFSGVPVVPVRTTGEIPRGKIREAMNYIKTITVNRPLCIGETVTENLLGLNVDLVVTSNILKEETWANP